MTLPNAASRDDPQPELLRRDGWTVKATYGSYCVVWRGHEEVVMVWRDGHWERAGSLRAAA
jgi:hypothetical protein